MNRQIRQAAVIVLALYAVLFVRLNVVQVVQADELNSHPVNNRQLLRDFEKPRGEIITADGEIVARSVEAEVGPYEYQRVYPRGDLYAHIGGYYGYLVGATGIERSYADELAGESAEFQLRALANLFDEEANVGDVVLSIDSQLQRQAKDLLGERRGSVVVIEPTTGAIKAMWSYPSFDPNALSTNDTEAGRRARAELLEAPGNPLLSRAYREAFAPGSTFKVVTAAAGLSSGEVSLDEPSYPETTEFTPPSTNRPLGNSGRSCGGTVGELLAVSCNTGFAEMGSITLGPQPMIKTAEAFGFNSKPPIDLPAPATSTFPTDYGRELGPVPGGGTAYEDSPSLAFASIGQGSVTSSPLQMALVTAAIGAGGEVPTPHVVDSIRDARGDTVRRVEPGPWRKALDKSVAADMKQIMVQVVEDGTAGVMSIDGWEVGAKTGTAQTRTGEDRSHAWMVGWAGQPGEPATAAVAVIVEAQDGVEEQTGARVAGPIANAMLVSTLNTLGGEGD
jgi:peptidoglycan glycosyltransferase